MTFADYLQLDGLNWSKLKLGIDSAWRQSYAPDSRAMRALILMERIERHASAAYWSRDEIQAYQNMRLFG